MSSHPVFVAVQSPDGSTSQVRVGTAHKEGDGFILELGALSIGGAAVAPAAPRAVASPASSSAPSSSGAGKGGMVFPNYGRSKNQPIAGASMGDLEYYASGCRRTLDDPGKARWHDKERELLAAIEAEMARQGGGGAPASPARGSAPASRGKSAPPPDDEPPPISDDDIPF